MTEQKARAVMNDLPECPPEIAGGAMVSGDSSSIPLLDFPADPELAADGWQRRFMADPPRAEEARIIYTDLGYEVRAEAIKPSELSVLCGDCRLATCHAYVTLYTRKSPP